MKVKIDNRTQRAILDDQFRKNSIRDIYFTCGAQSIEDQEGLMRVVREFDDFNEGNDPYREHDFGRIEKLGGFSLESYLCLFRDSEKSSLTQKRA